MTALHVPADEREAPGRLARRVIDLPRRDGLHGLAPALRTFRTRADTCASIAFRSDVLTIAIRPLVGAERTENTTE